MNMKGIGLSCSVAFCSMMSVANAQNVQPAVQNAVTPTQAVAVTAPAPVITTTAPVAQGAAPQQAATPAAQTAEVKAMPGAILMIWQGNDLSEAEIAAFVDKGKRFNIRNADQDPSAVSVRDKTVRWTGILNIDEPGLYTFNGTANVTKDSRWSVVINGVPVLGASGSATMSKNVQLPGPVNIEVVMHCSNSLRGSLAIWELLLRFKKAGTLAYTVITPETLYHTAE